MSDRYQNRKGIAYRMRYWALRMSERYHDFRLRVRTDALLSTDRLGFTNPDSREYGAVPYHILHRIFAVLDVDDDDVFLDIGCGMGRPLIVAARHGFRRVIGVELSAELCAIAQQNIATVRKLRRTPRMEVVQADATRYRIPHDVTVIFLANPFRGTTFDQVVDEIRRSLTEAPRRMRIVCYNSRLLEQTSSGQNWCRECLHTPCFPNVSWTLYETVPEAEKSGYRVRSSALS